MSFVRRDHSAKLDEDCLDPDGIVDREVRALLARNHREAVERVKHQLEGQWKPISPRTAPAANGEWEQT
jgi:hypothetical protein